GRLDARAGCGELLLADGDRAHLLRRKDLMPTRASFAAEGSIARLTAPSGPLVVVDGHRLNLVDAATGETTGALRGPGLEAAHESPLADGGVGPAGALLASVDEATRPARVWELGSGRLLVNLTLPATPCRLAWRPDGRALAIQAGATVLR